MAQIEVMGIRNGPSMNMSYGETGKSIRHRHESDPTTSMKRQRYTGLYYRLVRCADTRCATRSKKRHDSTSDQVRL